MIFSRLINKIGRFFIEFPFVEIFGSFNVDDENHTLSLDPFHMDIACYGFAGIDRIFLYLAYLLDVFLFLLGLVEIGQSLLRG